MATRYAPTPGLTVSPTREHPSFLVRALSVVLIASAFAIAAGVPLLLSGATGVRLSVGEGRSMEPTLTEGDFLLIRSVQVTELEPGDVVSYEHDGQRVMHRVMSITQSPEGEALLITRGDNNPANDPPVPESAVIGKLVYDFAWLPRLPIGPDAMSIFVAEWIASVTLLTLGFILRRNPTRPSNAALRRSYGG